MSSAESVSLCSAFAGTKCIAQGELYSVAGQVKQIIDQGEQANVLIFDDVTSEPIEVDFRGSLQAVLHRLPPPAYPNASAAENAVEVRTPGRPKLGVVAREVTLLPRHWAWLATQSGGASVAIRKLVEEAIRSHENTDRVRRAQESAYRFLSAMAGNQAGFEESVRALFANLPEQFGIHTESWPDDIRNHARMLALKVFVA